MRMENKICATCGTQYPAESGESVCLICADDRQYVPLEGQQWTTTGQLSARHTTAIQAIKPNLYEFVLAPTFAIGQRALLVCSPGGNVLWDCIPLLDQATRDFIRNKGGIQAIAISHPHYYSNMHDWAEAFSCPVYLPESEKNFVVYPGKWIKYWDSDKVDFWDGIELHKIGGHFPGSSILYVPSLSEKGAILCGDTFNLSLSLKHFSVMYSYPNKIPLPISEVQRIKNKMAGMDFDEIYGFWKYQNVTNAKELLIKSLDRYI